MERQGASRPALNQPTSGSIHSVCTGLSGEQRSVQRAINLWTSEEAPELQSCHASAAGIKLRPVCCTSISPLPPGARPGACVQPGHRSCHQEKRRSWIPVRVFSGHAPATEPGQENVSDSFTRCCLFSMWEWAWSAAPVRDTCRLAKIKPFT